MTARTYPIILPDMSKKIDDLLARVEAFLTRHSMKPTSFGIQACRDPSTVPRLRARKGITLERVEQIERFMEEYEGNLLRPRAKRIPRSQSVAA